jgi:phi13 family phage major tail protein
LNQKKEDEKIMNQIKHGLTNIHVAFVDESVTPGPTTNPAWEAPIALPGAVQFSVTPSGNATNFYGDDSIWFTFNGGGNVTGTLQLWNVPADIKARLLGDYIDEDGKYVETNDQGENFAILGQQAGTVSNNRFVYYNCTAGRGEYTYDTDQDTPQPKQDNLSITATRQYFPLLDVSVMASTANSVDAATAYTAFFNAVQLPKLPPIGD